MSATGENKTEEAECPVTSKFIVPIRRIKLGDDLTKFRKSVAFSVYVNFVERLVAAITNKAISSDYPISANVKKVCELCSTLSRWVDEIPPIKQPTRFGNKAFRIWLDRVNEDSRKMMASILPENLYHAIPEIVAYWVESFGNRVRIDYGTGHEMFMVAWLCFLRHLGVFEEADETAIVLQCFNQYLILMRKIQKVYRLEPAGSHGVWSLDDYQALPFVLGPAQLYNSDISPKVIKEVEMVNQLADDYLYFSCIKNVLQTKTGPFYEHSPILAQSADAASWKKVYQGMMRVYDKEVLDNLPLVQHFLFGSLFKFEPREQQQ